MKLKKTFFTLILTVMLGITPLCHAETSNDKTSPDEVIQETQDQRAEAIQKSKAELDELDKRIDALEASIDKSWDKMNMAAREKARASLRALHKQRIKVAEWYGSVKNGADDTWKHMKKGFSDSYETLQESWEKFNKEFGYNK
jgi:Skp family chaperone for outer membrane proteins